MDFSFLSRIATSCIAPLWSVFKKIGGERKAAQGDTVMQSPGEKIHKSTLVHLGANASLWADWATTYDVVVGHIIRSPLLAQAHVSQWLSLQDTQSRMKRLADAQIAGAPVPSDDHAALVVSYMRDSGDNKHRASDFVDLINSVLVAGVRGGVKDEALSAQLQISVVALHRRFDAFDQRMNNQDIPEPDWSFDIAYKANVDWLQNVFSSSIKAKKRLGQALSPADLATSLTSVSRSALTENLDRMLIDSPIGGVVAITGNEGNGKSWLVAQAWLTWTVKPLTLFLTAEDVGDQIVDPLTLLARKLCEQTDRQGDERHQAFWFNQLRVWRKQSSGQSLRLLVVLDGLNQRPKTKWSRAIDLLTDELERIDGKLILTSRKRYFDGIVKPSLVSPCRELSVPEWTPHERDELLAARDILPSQLHERVADSLCNPRLLSVALTLLDHTQLQAMEELSISLLLFEHLRASHKESYGQPVAYFARLLQGHAKQVLQRLDAQQRDDLNVFDGGLEAVVEGRFFVPLTDDLTRYTIHNDGLGLALGLAILDELHAASRNHRDLNEALALLTEPIAALDQTSEAILAALTVACVSDEHSLEIGAAILIGFASIQNPDECTFDAFAALVRVKPRVFIDAAHTLALQGGTAVNFDWIELALNKARTDALTWEELAPAIEDWLAHVTLDTESRVFSAGRSADEVAVRRLELREELDARLSSLSIEERDILGGLVQTEAPDVSALGRLALTLLAGMPLAPFAQSFVHWSFISSLNSSHQAPMKQFRHLVRFNGNDWSATRSGLLHYSQCLREDRTSNVGQWALVTLLGATGNPDDARDAKKLIDFLQTGRPAYRSWHWNERYCSTDPCNPDNAEPDNVAQTAAAYAEIDVKELAQHMGQNDHDRFFNDARPAVARYFTDTAIERQRSLFDDVLHRSGTSLRQGVVSLLEHGSLITHEQANRFVRRTCGSEADIEALHSLGKEAHVWTLFQMELAFPVLSAAEQLNVLLQARLGGALSNNLIELIKPLDIEPFEAALAKAIEALDSEAQLSVLLFTPFVKQPLPNVTREFLPALLNSELTLVRAYTLWMVARSGDPAALDLALKSRLVRSDQTSREYELEHWHYSAVLLEAAVKSIVPWETVVANMEFRHVACLSSHLGGDVTQYFANVVDALFKRALGLQVESGILEMEVRQYPSINAQPQYIRLREQEKPPASFDEAMRRANEDESSFNERQGNLHTAFLAFRASLVSNDALRLLDQFSLEDLASTVATDTARAEEWTTLLLAQPSGAQLGAARNMALLLAREISIRDASTAVRLFEKFASIRPLIRNVFGRTGIELGAMAVWSAAKQPELDALRSRRLDCAINNDELAQEVWAALWQGKSCILRQYIDARLNSSWPAAQARAILVAGLMGENSHSNDVLNRFAGVPGLLGDTQHIANELYQRHVWAMHWYAQMCAARSPEDFWRAAVLFRVVADGRIEAVPRPSDEPTASFLLYWPGAMRQIHNRFDKLRDKWKKNLFADEAPLPLFLSSSNQE